MQFAGDLEPLLLLPSPGGWLDRHAPRLQESSTLIPHPRPDLNLD